MGFALHSSFLYFFRFLCTIKTGHKITTETNILYAIFLVILSAVSATFAGLWEGLYAVLRNLNFSTSLAYFFLKRQFLWLGPTFFSEQSLIGVKSGTVDQSLVACFLTGDTF